MPQTIKGRFAPSPSGRMHLGNIFTALMSWLSVKSRDGKWLLRIEDLDRQRSRREYALLIEDDLLWLGLEWDEGGLEGKGANGPYLQSERDSFYLQALDKLIADGLTYPCYCTRADILSTQAPHQSDGRIVYSGRCRRNPPESSDRNPAIRLIVDDSIVSYDDLICGRQSFDLARECGDFILRRGDGAWAYQLAVIVDDAAMGVTEVMRGNDLLLSGAQQTWLYGRLGMTPPAFAHLPLICNDHGQRLSKRDASLSMEALRSRLTPRDLTGILAFHAGLLPAPIPLTPSELCGIVRESGVSLTDSLHKRPSKIMIDPGLG